jgi:photosystem I subunit 9
MEGLQKFFSLAPVILFLWLAETAVWLILFNYKYPDLLFHP